MKERKKERKKEKKKRKEKVLYSFCSNETYRKDIKPK